MTIHRVINNFLSSRKKGIYYAHNVNEVKLVFLIKYIHAKRKKCVTSRIKKECGNSLLSATVTVAIFADINLYAATVVELIKMVISKGRVLIHRWES